MTFKMLKMFKATINHQKEMGLMVHYQAETI